jgi:hypothetical protein
MSIEDYKKLLATAESAGLKILSDEHCCKLLAWTLAYGGGNEAVVNNLILLENIRYAQRRCNVFGGEIVNPELIVILKQYLREAESIVKGDADKVPKWANEICDYYGLKRMET